MMAAAMDGYAGVREDQDLRRYLAHLPSPAELAADLPTAVRKALRAAWHTREGWRVASLADAQLLRPRGLCEYPFAGNPGLMLTNFGVEVRRQALAGERQR